MNKSSEIQGKHARHARQDVEVRPALYTDSTPKKSKQPYKEPRESKGIARSIFAFLLSFILGLAIIGLAAGFAYVQAKEIDITTTSPVEIAKDFYHAVYAKATGQEYTSRFDKTPDTPKPESESSPQILPAQDKQTSSAALTSSSETTVSSSEVVQDKELPTPLVAEYDGVLIHSLVRASHVTGIMFHQASYEYALVLDTKLPDIDAETVMTSTRKIDISKDQPTGDEYMNAPAMHVWRQEITDLDTSIDIGSAPDTEVLAPVTGTVVLVREYDLFDTIKDFEVHIQPEGRPDLDAVCIHIKNVSVKAGDKVVGGVTPIAQVRDIVGEGIMDIQLGVFIDAYGGNHCHVQVNNTNYEKYKEERLKDAYKVKE